MERRQFLKSAALAGAAVPLHALLARAQGVKRGQTEGYGPLFETPDRTTGLPLLLLPRGFTYVSFGWTGDPLTGGAPTPSAHDGMAAFHAGNGDVWLVRNHERTGGNHFGPVAYDADAGGGTTTLRFDGNRGELLDAYGSLTGTVRNCAGGPTPWGSWLTCEETNNFTTLPHGYVFEVPAGGYGNPVPLRDMGRFSHEAAAVDPATGYVYETEDSGNDSGFYRYVPNVPGQLAIGGTLWMLKVVGVDNQDLTVGFAHGTTFDVEWVQVAQPDNPTVGSPSNWVAAQGIALGGALFSRLEGCWYDGSGLIYFASTSGGGAGEGQVWAYNPSGETLTLVFESPDRDVLDSPDNITVSPRGGLVLCEDGGGVADMHGLTVDGEIFKFAQNNVVLNGEHNGISGDFTGSEWAGACYSPDGRWLFVNIQSPGITFAIRGPWASGAL